MEFNNKELKKLKLKRILYYMGLCLAIGAEGICLLMGGNIGMIASLLGICIIAYDDAEKNDDKIKDLENMIKYSQPDEEADMEEPNKEESEVLEPDEILDPDKDMEDFREFAMFVGSLFGMSVNMYKKEPGQDEREDYIEVPFEDYTEAKEALRNRANNILITFSESGNSNLTEEEADELYEICFNIQSGNVPGRLVDYYDTKLSEFEGKIFDAPQNLIDYNRERSL